MKIIKSRVIKILIITFLISIILGIISFIISDKNNLNISVFNYIDLIKKGKFNYILGLYNSIKSNIIVSFIIWIFGIIFIFSVISLIIIAFKGISLGFMISSIIYAYRIKGLLIGLILLINNLFNIIILILLSYYSINFSIKSFNTFRNNRNVNYRDFYIKYIYLYLIFVFLLIFSSLFEIYISSNLIRFVV